MDKFATSVNCIDGRVQNPISEWMKKYLSVDYVDMITEPGPDKKLSRGPAKVIESLRQKVMISVKVHNSSTVAVSAHYNCAGNPVSKEEHLKQIKKSIKVIKSWGLPVRILGLWINKQWRVEVIEDFGEMR